MTSTSTSELGAIARVKSMSAVTSSSKEEVSVTWRIENFLAEVNVAAAKRKEGLTLSFSVGGWSGCDFQQGQVPLLCTLECLNSSAVKLTLSLKNPEAAAAAAWKPPHELWSFFSAERWKGVAKHRLSGDKDPKNLASGGWGSLTWNFQQQIAQEVEAPNESLTFVLKVTTYAISTEEATAAVDDDDVIGGARDYRQGLLSGVESLLGDVETSDVKVSIVDDGGKVLRNFLCHKAILSARSSVFRAMFGSCNGMIENQDGVVRVEDVSTEAMDQFLTFLYSGRLKGNTEGTSFEPVWVKLLPQLVCVADKYDVVDLKDFCDANLHRAATKENAQEIYNVAKHLGLLKAVAKMRALYSKNIDLLLEATPK